MSEINKGAVVEPRPPRECMKCHRVFKEADEVYVFVDHDSYGVPGSPPDYIELCRQCYLLTAEEPIPF